VRRPPGARRGAAAALLALAVVACSSPPAPVPMAGPVVNRGTADDATAAPPAALTIQLGDDWFSPTFVRVPAGATLEVTLVDTGDVAHTFTIAAQHIDLVLDRRGQTRMVTISGPSAGHPVVFSCKYHQAVGMQGAFYAG
jgi:plastocyanin